MITYNYMYSVCRHKEWFPHAVPYISRQNASLKYESSALVIQLIEHLSRIQSVMEIENDCLETVSYVVWLIFF